ncbi:hypothetical protein I2486_14870 [Cellulophaga sp. E16_2]|uniref:DUF7151 domain-containing protein n=1 Tax=Cellulophaga algicola (strain DSM 14237 / IC166 / ACAM 630) TaxID=688270 RepID=E6XF47_CELAD|nr:MULTISPECIES: hypothetical protein [Cellulophaga]ADV50283.1 hypothetical protein Celal_3008 [Cellulophaga algicola DSM 14237]MBO0592685.1 hypothetical protein [Cellulophaga sp. E16_2]
MKKVNLLYFILSILFIACEGDQGSTGSQGSNGSTSLINITDEAPGSNCDNGGLKIETGLDSNANGILESNEVQNTRFVCNGINGNTSLTTVITEPAGANCTNGGIKINAGLDVNGNGNLEESEITSSAFICNGVDGDNNGLTRITNENAGVTCANGGLKVDYGIDVNNDGVLNDLEVDYTTYACFDQSSSLSLINITDEPEGSFCENGGIKIDTGLDLNGNQVLDDAEIQITKYVCNGIDGIINEEIRIKIVEGIGTAATTTSSTPILISGISFDKRNFDNIDAIFFESDPYVSNNSNFALVELYNISDNVGINNTLLRTNNVFSLKEALLSNDIFNELPEEEINLGIRFSAELDGEFSASGIPYLVLRRSN